MRALVAGEYPELISQIGAILTRNGWSCPEANRVAFDALTARAARSAADLIVVILSPDPAPGLAGLRELRASTQATLVAIGPGDNPQLILRSLREGAHEYLGEQELASELEPALVRIRSQRATESGRLICVASANGGSGSSTLAANVATVLANHYQRAALLDLNLSTGDQAALFDLQPTHTLADFCRNLDRMDQCMFEQLFVRHESGVHLLAAPTRWRSIDQVTAHGVGEAVSMARGQFPFVIADLGHHFVEEQLAAIPQAEVVLVVTRLEFAALRNTRKMVEYLGELGVSAERLRVVANRHKQPKEIPAAKAEQALGMKLSHLVPNDPGAVNGANNKGVPVVLERPWSRVSKSLTDLAMSVNGASGEKKRRGLFRLW